MVVIARRRHLAAAPNVSSPSTLPPTRRCPRPTASPLDAVIAPICRTTTERRPPRTTTSSTVRPPPPGGITCDNRSNYHRHHRRRRWSRGLTANRSCRKSLPTICIDSSLSSNKIRFTTVNCRRITVPRVSSHLASTWRHTTMSSASAAASATCLRTSVCIYRQIAWTLYWQNTDPTVLHACKKVININK